MLRRFARLFRRAHVHLRGLTGDLGDLLCNSRAAVGRQPLSDNLPIIDVAKHRGAEKLQRLKSPELEKLIHAAVTLEPRIGGPPFYTDVRKFIMPPHLHEASAAYFLARKIRRLLKQAQYDTLICVSGDADCSQQVAAARTGSDARSVLVIATEHTPQTLPDLEIVDLSAIRTLRHELKLAVLLDVIRGVQASAIHNLDSKATRQLMRRFKTQIRAGALAVRPEARPVTQKASLPPPVFDVSAILTVHNEGPLIASSFSSLQRNVAAAASEGLSVETIVAVDRPSRSTSKMIRNLDLRGVSLIETDFGDQGKTRNAAISRAQGAAIAFLDGDDLWGENWLAAASSWFRQLGAKVILHPEFSLYFGKSNNVLVPIDQTDPLFDTEFLRFGNYYDALSFASRDVHVANPYPTRDIKNGFAYEDWHWNCVTIERGYIHRVVPGTVHFKRKRSWSQNVEANRRRALVWPSALFSYAWYK